MNLTLSPIKTFVMKKFGRTMLKIRRYSPEIATGAGIVCGVACVVVACVQTTKLDKIIDSTKEKVDEIHKTKEDKHENYTEKDMSGDLVKVYARTSVDIVKLYAFPAGLGALSIAFILGGHRILRKENAAAAAAYMALSESFAQYRKRVAEDQGQDKDREYLYGRKEEAVVEIDNETDTAVKKNVIKDNGCISPYARIFDEINPNFGPSHYGNMVFLKSVQQYCTDKLIAQGHLFLNEVYDALGFPRSEAGQYVGWVYGMGDDFVDFGINDIEEKGDEDGFLLDFNVDGPIMYILNRMTFNGLDEIEELKVKKHYTESLRKKNKSKTRR